MSCTGNSFSGPSTDKVDDKDEKTICETWGPGDRGILPDRAMPSRVLRSLSMTPESKKKARHKKTHSHCEIWLQYWQTCDKITSVQKSSVSLL